jgi:hypothetical protein
LVKKSRRFIRRNRASLAPDTCPPPCARLWPVIVAQFEKCGLLAFGLLPSLKLLAAQFAKALGTVALARNLSGRGKKS